MITDFSSPFPLFFLPCKFYVIFCCFVFFGKRTNILTNHLDLALAHSIVSIGWGEILYQMAAPDGWKIGDVLQNRRQSMPLFSKAVYTTIISAHLDDPVNCI